MRPHNGRKEGTTTTTTIFVERRPLRFRGPVLSSCLAARCSPGPGSARPAHKGKQRWAPAALAFLPRSLALSRSVMTDKSHYLPASMAPAREERQGELYRTPPFPSSFPFPPSPALTHGGTNGGKEEDKMPLIRAFLLPYTDGDGYFASPLAGFSRFSLCVRPSLSLSFSPRHPTRQNGRLVKGTDATVVVCPVRK